MQNRFSINHNYGWYMNSTNLVKKKWIQLISGEGHVQTWWPLNSTIVSCTKRKNK